MGGEAKDEGGGGGRHDGRMQSLLGEGANLDSWSIICLGAWLLAWCSSHPAANVRGRHIGRGLPIHLTEGTWEDATGTDGAPRGGGDF